MVLQNWVRGRFQHHLKNRKKYVRTWKEIVKKSCIKEVFQLGRLNYHVISDGVSASLNTLVSVAKLFRFLNPGRTSYHVPEKKEGRGCVRE